MGPYQKRAQEDMQRYQREMETYQVRYFLVAQLFMLDHLISVVLDMAYTTRCSSQVLPPAAENTDAELQFQQTSSSPVAQASSAIHKTNWLSFLFLF